MNYILFDPINIEDSYPFTLTRPFAELRTFGGTIKEHWENLLGCKVSYFTNSLLNFKCNNCKCLYSKCGW